MRLYNKHIGVPMEKVVVSIGGSILVPGNNDSEFILKLSEMLRSICDKVQIAVVCGGGKTARHGNRAGAG